MATFISGTNPNLTGGTSTNDLSRDIYVETLEAFNRTTVFKNLVYVQTINSGKSGQFIIGGKATGDGATEYSTGGTVTYGDGKFDEKTILLNKPLYQAKVLDQFEEKVAHYPTRSIITSQMGEALANKLDQDIANTLCEDYASALNTPTAGLVDNPDAIAGIDVSVSGGADAEAKGDLIAEAIFTAKASLEANDDMGEAYCVLTPINFAYLVQSKKAVNADYNPSSNGSYAMGTVMDVGGVKVLKSNNLPATVTNNTTGSLATVGVVFTRQAVGVLELVGLKTKQEADIDMLDATKMVAYYMNGIDTLRTESKVVLFD